MALLFTIAPLDPATGNRVTLRFASADDERLTGLDGEKWWPGVVQPPALNREGWNFNFDGSISIAQCAFDMRLDALKAADPQAPAYRYAGAPVMIYRGEPGDAWGDFEELFVGLVISTPLEGGQMKVTAQVDSEPFEANVLEAVYGGFGGDTGMDDLSEAPKPAVFGAAMNVEPVLIDVVNNVFQVHGYGSIQAINAVHERAVNFGPGLGDYADYAALVAADIPEGRWATCLAQGMFKLGAPPYGLITADVEGDNVGGYHQSTAEVMLRLCDICGVDSARIDAASIAALDAAVPYAINLYLRQPETLIDVLSRLVRPCNAHLGLSWTGLLQVTRFGAIPTPTITLDVQGRQLPPVLGSAEQAVPAPFWRLEMTANRNWRVHSKDEIVFEDEDLVEVPVTLWRAYPEMPPTPIGNDTPAGWLTVKPEMSRPNLMSDGDILFGPVWESHGKQKGGITTAEGWSEPRLDDARYKGWVIAGKEDSDIPLAGADSIRADSLDYFDQRWITRSISGPFRLSWTVRDSDTKAIIGVAVTDPDTQPYPEVVTGFALAPNEAEWGLDTGGIYPFNDFDLDGGFATDGFNRSHAGVPSATEYQISYNGEVMTLRVNGTEVRSYWFDTETHGEQFWPVFILQTHALSNFETSEIYDIVWEPASPARSLEFPYAEQTGALRRLFIRPGWEAYAPFLTGVGPVGFLEADDFRGGGRMEFRHGGTSGGASAATIAELRTATSNVGRIELKGNGTFTVKVGSVTKATGSWFSNDLWTISYTGSRANIYRNGILLTNPKVTRGQTVYPGITFGPTGRVWDLRVVPLDESEYAVKGSVIASDPADITDASPQDVSGYTIIAETADLAISAGTEGDQFVATAMMEYDLLSGTAVGWHPDAKVQWSGNSGSSWTDIVGTWSPSPLHTATVADAARQASFVGDAVDVTGTVTRRFRLVAKNNLTGTYSVSFTAASFVAGEWQA